MNIFNAYNYLIESNDLGRLKKIFSRYELFKKSLNVPGDIVECGVFKGTGHIFWLKLLKIFDEHSIKKVIGFDTFENFSKSILDFEKKNAKKFTKEAKFKNNVSINSINKKISELNLLDRSELIKGDVIKTAPNYAKNNRGFKISLLNLDLDTYEGTKAALESFYKKISRGGIIILDEYGKRGWGETDAVDEFLDNHKELKIETVKFSNQPTAFIVKKI
jgi:Macrocin-O-methyltransferase (TylF)